MSQRRILLIDADLEFHRLLSSELKQFGVEVVRDAAPEALGRIAELGAEAVFIAVDEPEEKKGYSLFSKAKRGPAARIPVVLVTQTISPEGFAGHRKLKVHADDYLDKRGLSPHVLVGKLHNLLELEESEVHSLTDIAVPTDDNDDLALPVEVDEVALDDGVMVDEVDGAELDLGAIDDFADEGQRTQAAPEGLGDALFDAEFDAGFDSLITRAPASPTSPPPLAEP
ncbi:MAG: response regulator, partial [Kofleriaceae bacterium]